MGRVFTWLWRVESRRLLWLLGLTFALIVTFQYIELPYSISSIFSSSKLPISTNSPSLLADLTPAMAPTDSTGYYKEREVEANHLLDGLAKPPAPAISPTIATLMAPATLNPPGVKKNAIAPVVSAKPPTALPGLVPSPVKENAAMSIIGDIGDASSVVRFVPDMEENARMSDSAGVMSISEMSKQLRRNRISHNRQAKKPKWVTKPDLELLKAKYEIENAPIIDDTDPLLYSPLYLNVSIFKRSYELMEKMLKVYVYKEGDKPIMHNPFLKGVYSSEGWFMKLIESNSNFVTKDAAKAHLFYLPFSTRMLEVTLYVKDSHSNLNLIKYLKDYIDFVSVKYPFWNRTSGADHFFAACHDWAPAETRTHMAKTIRGLCNTDVKEGFVFGKDTSLPETFVVDPKKPSNNIGGNSASQRPILAFFAGKPNHGYLRHILLSYWGNNKDPDLKIFGKLPRMRGNKNYLQFMKTSKYCICAKGFEVNSPRVVEAISYECVPVIISDNFVPPFFEVLNWEAFAVFVAEKDIPNLKKILMGISEGRYRQMQMMVKRVQKHFLWHVKPEKYDMFHMILHSFWFNRVFQISV